MIRAERINGISVFILPDVADSGRCGIIFLRIQTVHALPFFVQKPNGLRPCNAVGIQAAAALEGLHGSLGIFSEFAVDRIIQITAVGEHQLQFPDAVRIIRAPEERAVRIEILFNLLAAACAYRPACAHGGFCRRDNDFPIAIGMFCSFQRARADFAAYAAFPLFITFIAAAGAELLVDLPAVAFRLHGRFLFVQAALPAFKNVIAILCACGGIEIGLFKVVGSVLGVIPAVALLRQRRKKNQRKQHKQRKQAFFHPNIPPSVSGGALQAAAAALRSFEFRRILCYNK